MYFVISIFFIIIILILVYQCNSNKYTESFSNHKLIDVQFISKKNAGTIFQKTSSIRNYINSFRLYEKKIKGCYHKSTTNCLELYSKNFQDFTTDEKTHIYLVIINIVQKLVSVYPKLDIFEWNIIKSNHHIEDGMPFTLSKYIILPESIIQRSINTYIETGLIDSIKFLGDILIHEQIHIIQRKNQSLFNQFYQSKWNFSYYSNIHIPKKINDRIRTNPDGLDVNWVYNNKYLILSLLRNRYSLSSINIKHFPIYLHNNKYYLKTAINNTQAYKSFFCNISFPYHPNEIAAYLFSDIMLSSMGLKKIDYNCPAIKSYLIWLKHNFS